MVRKFTAHYLYALVDGLPEEWGPPATGGIVLRRVGDLRLVETPLAEAPQRTPRMLGRHGEIVAGLMDAEAVLPFAPGTIVPAGSLRPWLSAHLPTLHATLIRLRGHVEIMIRLVPIAAGGSEALAALAERLAEHAGATAWRYRVDPRRSGAELALLIRRGQESAVLTRVAPVIARAAGVAVVPTAPRPPYAFVPPLDTAPWSVPAEPVRPATILAG